jgi:hypothetical protein
MDHDAVADSRLPVLIHVGGEAALWRPRGQKFSLLFALTTTIFWLLPIIRHISLS